MMPTKKVVHVDTDAFFALAATNDALHERAVRQLEFLEKEQFSVVTNNLVVLETITVLSYEIGRAEALKFADFMYSPTEPIFINRVEEAWELQGLAVYKKAFGN